MVVYRDNQGDGLWIVFKFVGNELDTGSYNGSYARKPPARTYNKRGPAKAQWNRFIKDGYRARVAEVFIDDSGSPQISWVDQEWIPSVELCKFYKYGKTCKLPKGHEGIHK